MKRFAKLAPDIRSIAAAAGIEAREQIVRSKRNRADAYRVVPSGVIQQHRGWLEADLCLGFDLVYPHPVDQIPNACSMSLGRFCRKNDT